MGKTQIIKFEQNHCNADINDNSVLFVRVSGVVTQKDALVEVPYTHNAYIIKGGGEAEFLKSGTYPIFDSRTDVKNFKRGYSVDIVYIPKDTNVVILWGTPDKIVYRDSSVGSDVEIAARGSFGVTVTNPEQFFRKVVGARREFDLNDFRARFSAAVVSEFSDCFLRVVKEQGIAVNEFDAEKKKIGEEVGKILSEKFDRSWGIGLTDFIIEHVGITSECRSAIAKAAEQRKAQEREEKTAVESEKQRTQAREIAERDDDKNWEREKFKLELQARIEESKIYAAAQAAQSGGKKAEESRCEKCGYAYSAADSFCPRCGSRLRPSPCQSCGHINAPSASFCSGCGKKL